MTREVVRTLVQRWGPSAALKGEDLLSRAQAQRILASSGEIEWINLPSLLPFETSWWMKLKNYMNLMQCLTRRSLLWDRNIGLKNGDRKKRTICAALSERRARKTLRSIKDDNGHMGRLASRLLQFLISKTSWDRSDLAMWTAIWSLRESLLRISS